MGTVETIPIWKQIYDNNEWFNPTVHQFYQSTFANGRPE